MGVTGMSVAQGLCRVQGFRGSGVRVWQMDWRVQGGGQLNRQADRYAGRRATAEGSKWSMLF